MAKSKNNIIENAEVGEVVTFTMSAYKLVCKECGKVFYSENPRRKKCQECISANIHRRCSNYYQEVIKKKKQEAKREREEHGKETVCVVCGETFIAYDGRRKTCPSCLEKREQRKNKTKVNKQ